MVVWEKEPRWLGFRPLSQVVVAVLELFADPLKC